MSISIYFLRDRSRSDPEYKGVDIERGSAKVPHLVAK